MANRKFAYRLALLFVLAALALCVLAYMYKKRDEPKPIAHHAAEGETTVVDVETPVMAGVHNWPQYRGLKRDGISVETDWVAAWSEAPKKLWEKNVGIGSSSMAVSQVLVSKSRGVGVRPVAAADSSMFTAVETLMMVVKSIANWSPSICGLASST